MNDSSKNSIYRKKKLKKRSVKRFNKLVRPHRRPPVGARPGTLAPAIENHPTDIRVIDYTESEVKEFEINRYEDLASYHNSSSISWIDIQGLSDSQTLEKVAAIFGMHYLTLADAVNIPSRPKSEFYDNAVFVITDMVTMKAKKGIIHEQLSIFFGEGFVVTFQERPLDGDVLDPVRDRIRSSKGSIRKQGSDYLAAAIIDTVIDSYFPVLEQLGEMLEDLEDEVINNSTQETITKIHRSRRDLLGIRRALWPLREALSGLLREEHRLIKHENKIYLRDSYEHLVQLLDIVETYRELCSGLTDVYLSSANNRLNEVMKVLTIIATIFIPLSFFASVYGMNFEYLPELKWRDGYLYFWIAMIGLASTMIALFVRAGWIKAPSWLKN